MLSQQERRGRLRPIMVLIILVLGAVLTGSVAMAGLPTGNQAGSLPTGQGNASVQQGDEDQKLTEDPRKGTQADSPPAALSLVSGAQQPSGGPTPCGPESIYFELEPNNTITTAMQLGSKNNAEVRAQINAAGDIDYFSFVANAGDRIWAYAFTLGATNSTDSQLQLLNSISQTLQFDDDNGSQADLSSAVAGKVVTQTGTYYLRVNAFSSTSTIYNYTLFIDRTSTAPIAEIEPNDTFTQTNPYAMGSVVTGTISTTADNDVYAFEFFDDDRYVFQVDGDPERDGSEFDANFDLMNASGAVLVTVDSDSQFDVREVNSENAAFFIDTGGPPTATLLLRVRTDNDGGGTATGTYNLHIWRVGEVPCGSTQTPTATQTATPVCNTFFSEIEPNSTFSTAQTLPTLNNLEVRAPINPAGDIDYYTGNATAGDKMWVYLFTGQSTSGADTELRLMNAVSTTIEFDDDNGSQTAAASGIAGAPITTSGAIYFKLNEFNNDGTVTPYSLFIDRTSSTPNVTEVEVNDVYTQANMVTVGDLITGTISATTDLDVFGFTANAADRIIFQADSDPERDGTQYNPNFQILDSAGVQLVAVDSDSTLGDRRSEHHAFTFGAAGTYYVRMSSDVSGPTTGSYNLHLWRTANPPCASPTPIATNTNTPTVTATATTILPTATTTSTATRTNTAVPPTATATVCVPSGLNIASAQNPVVVDGGMKSPVYTGATRPQSEIVKSASVSGAAPKQPPPAPAAPNVVLYDQLNNAGTFSTNSQQFEAANAAFNNQAADDFAVPAGQNWQVTQVDAQGVYFNGPGPAASFNVYFYTSVVSGTYTIPGAPVYTATGQTYLNTAGVFAITLGSPPTLAGGSTYYVSVQAQQNFTPAGQWGWTNRTVQSTGLAAWRNPGGGFGPGCVNWDRRTFCVGQPTEPDQMFRLNGNIVGGGGCPSATNTAVPPTATNTTVAASATATVCVPGAPIQETEPNNTIASANPVGTSGSEVRGGITPAGDQDFFSFQANAGDRIWAYINTSNAAPSTDFILTLFNVVSTTIQLDDDNGFQSTLSSAIAGGVITRPVLMPSRSGSSVGLPSCPPTPCTSTSPEVATSQR